MLWFYPSDPARFKITLSVVMTKSIFLIAAEVSVKLLKFFPIDVIFGLDTFHHTAMSINQCEISFKILNLFKSISRPA